LPVGVVVVVRASSIVVAVVIVVVLSNMSRDWKIGWLCSSSEESPFMI